MFALKRLILSFFILAILALLAGCKGRDLSTPSGRLVGHWLNNTQQWHDYYGPIDEKTKTGSYVQVDDEGSAFYAEYRVISEDLSGESITFQVTSPSLPDELWPTMDLLVAKDGMSLVNPNNYSMDITYVDDKVEP